MSRQLVGIYICLFIKEVHMNHVAEVRTSSEGTGIMGMMGNKGGVGVRFKFYESTLCFINAHLAAHMGGVNKRNQNFQDILRRTVFDGGQDFLPLNHEYVFVCNLTVLVFSFG